MYAERSSKCVCIHSHDVTVKYPVCYVRLYYEYGCMVYGYAKYVLTYQNPNANPMNSFDSDSNSKESEKNIEFVGALPIIIIINGALFYFVAFCVPKLKSKRNKCCSNESFSKRSIIQILSEHNIRDIERIQLECWLIGSCQNEQPPC